MLNLILAVVFTATPVHAHTEIPWPHCPTDEGIPRHHRCVWDARHMGNGLGRSFIATHRGRVITYVPHRFAHELAGL